MNTYRIALAVTAATVSMPAYAGVYADDLGRCLVSSTTPSDRVTLMTWMFSAMSAEPSLAKLASMTEKQRSDADRNMAKLFDRLVLDQCRKQTIDAVKYEGQASLQSSFEVLGKVAMRQIIDSPDATRAVGRFADQIDKTRLGALLTEAGQATPPAPAK